MYHLDPHINTAVESQADRVRAVQAIGARPDAEQAAPAWPASGQSWMRRLASRVGLALAVAAPLVLLAAWVLMRR